MIKKTIFFLFPFVLLFSGCATSDTFLGLPTTKYVDTRLGERDERIRQSDEKIASARSELTAGLAESKGLVEESIARLGMIDGEVTSIKTRMQELDKLLVEISDLRLRTKDVETLAQRLEAKLGTVSKETLRELSNVLDSYLGSEPRSVRVMASPDSSGTLNADPVENDSSESVLKTAEPDDTDTGEGNDRPPEK